jgi:hypothetical protein
VTAAHLARWPRYDNAEMDRLLKCRRLVLDDLGTEYMDEKGNFMAVLDEVIADRYANERPTLITTNLTVEEFRDRYKNRIADRIRDNGKFLSVVGDSRRRQSTDEDRARIADAEERKRAADLAARPKATCELHLYGQGDGRVCNDNCPLWGATAWPQESVKDLVRTLADAKSVLP